MSEAIFAYKGDRPRFKGNLSGLPQIFDLLRERDIDASISLGGEAAYGGQGIEVHTLDHEPESITAKGRLGYDRPTVLINRLNRTLDHAQMPSAAVSMPVINANGTRDITNEKSKVYESILRPARAGIPTTVLGSINDASRFADEHMAARYVIKPNRGSGSKGITIVDRDDIGELEVDTFDGSKIIQPMYNFCGRLPAGLKPYDRSSEPLFRDVGASDASKELRVYGFHSPEQTDVFAVGRAIKDGQDEWFFVDPDSISEKVHNLTGNIMSHTAQLTGATALFGALDFGFGNLDGEDPNWHVVELNSKQPYMIGYDKHGGVAHHLRGLFADQIRSTVAS